MLDRLSRLASTTIRSVCCLPIRAGAPHFTNCSRFGPINSVRLASLSNSHRISRTMETPLDESLAEPAAAGAGCGVSAKTDDATPTRIARMNTTLRDILKLHSCSSPAEPEETTVGAAVVLFECYGVKRNRVAANTVPVPKGAARVLCRDFPGRRSSRSPTALPRLDGYSTSFPHIKWVLYTTPVGISEKIR